LLAELLLQIVFEAIAELGTRKARSFKTLQPPHPVSAAMGYLMFGGIAGGLSLLVWPDSFIDSKWLQWVNLWGTPILAGTMMAWLGRWRRRKGQELIRLDKFNYGFLFALAMATVRFFWAR
jgi:hypothetical protein